MIDFEELREEVEQERNKKALPCEAVNFKLWDILLPLQEIYSKEYLIGLQLISTFSGLSSYTVSEAVLYAYENIPMECNLNAIGNFDTFIYEKHMLANIVLYAQSCEDVLSCLIEEYHKRAECPLSKYDILFLDKVFKENARDDEYFRYDIEDLVTDENPNIQVIKPFIASILDGYNDDINNI